MSDDDLYEEWIKQRRSATPPSELTEHIMHSVEELQTQQRKTPASRLAFWIERSSFARYAACSAALLVGSTPFLAYFLYLLVL